MDEETRQFLKESGFEKYTDVFEKQEIDSQALETLTDPLSLPLVKDLIPTVGPQSKFLRCLSEYLTQKKVRTSNEGVPENPYQAINDEDMGENSTESNQVEDNDASNKTQQPSCEPRSWNDVDNDVTKYLRGDVEGACLFAIYEKRSFTKSERTKLSSIVIKQELNGDTTKVISPARFKELSSQIEEIFPEEKAYKYYIEGRTGPSGNRISPRGSLYNSYTNLSRGFRKDGLRPSIRKPPESTRVVTLVSDDVLQALHDLKNKQLSWTAVEKYWDLTAVPRREELLQPTISQNQKKTKRTFAAKQDEHSILAYMKKYLPVMQPLGIYLLAKDFLKAYPEVVEDALSLAWQKIISFLKIYHPEKEDFSDDLEVLQLFAAQFDPFPINGKGKKSEERAFWRPSKAEIVEGFILHVTAISQLETSIKSLRGKLATVKKTLQPIPIVVDCENGNRICYVQIENVKYSVPSVRAALDLCFKSFHALHAEYPVQSAGPWMLLQRGVYLLSTPWDYDDANLLEYLEILKDA